MAAKFVLRSVVGNKRVEIDGVKIAGRNPDSDLVLSEGHPSRRHAELTTDDRGVWVTDLGSANGTFVNGNQVKDRTALKAGDRVRFDAEEFVLESTAPATADPNATVVRPAEPSSADHQTVVAQNRPRAPGSWADPEQRQGQGTRLFDPAELEEMRAPSGDRAATETAGTVDAPYLVVQSGRHGGERLKLAPGRATNVWEIGAEAARDIVIDDAGVSGFHAKIVNEGNRWKVIDQMSANGTFVNGQKANISYLKHGDKVRIGPIECLFQLPASSAPAAQTAATKGRPAWLTAAIAFAITIAGLAAAFVWFS